MAIRYNNVQQRRGALKIAKRATLCYYYKLEHFHGRIEMCQKYISQGSNEPKRRLSKPRLNKPKMHKPRLANMSLQMI